MHDWHSYSTDMAPLAFFSGRCHIAPKEAMMEVFNSFIEFQRNGR